LPASAIESLRPPLSAASVGISRSRKGRVTNPSIGQSQAYASRRRAACQLILRSAPILRTVEASTSKSIQKHLNEIRQSEEQDWRLIVTEMGIDTRTPMGKAMAHMADILVNDRLGIPGDFVTPEQYQPASCSPSGARLLSAAATTLSRLPNAEIADRVAVSRPTVKSHWTTLPNGNCVH
jgi:hypothetical protein